VGASKRVDWSVIGVSELRTGWFLCLGLLVFCGTGCKALRLAGPDRPPYDRQIYQPYNRVVLRVSSPADVLAVIHKPEYELLSQSESVVASWGQKREGYKNWFNMVAFDEQALTASRKYVLIVDDRPNILEEPRKDLMFDCEMVLQPDVFEGPFADDNARRIAVLQRVKENTRHDFEQVGADNNMLAVCGMMANQALEAALVKLTQSPALAYKLDEPLGLQFSHVTFGTGRIQMFLERDIVSIKIRLGRAAKRFEAAQLEMEKKQQVGGAFPGL